MTLIVQKFGGSSVGSIKKIEAVAQRVSQGCKAGAKVVVVVSAMRGETDRLLALAHQISPQPDPRESDQLIATGEQVSASLLAMALKHRGIQARSMTASQMGLRTDGAFAKARIKTFNSLAFKKVFRDCNVVVAAGFQGIDQDGNVTTLGRGGSDTSAVALAAGLGARECEIYTDVLGVYTADPNICADARKLDAITFEEMMEMASQGSKVLQIRSVELAMNHRIPLRVRSTFSDDPGTLVREDAGDLEQVIVRGVSHNINEVKLTLRQVPDRPGVAAMLFSALAEESINVDVIVQNTSRSGTTDLSFTTDRTDMLRAESIVKAVAKSIGVRNIEVDPDIAKVSVVGVGMRSHAGIAARMFKALHDAKINIQMITTSEIKVTCVIQEKDAVLAVCVLHDVFELGKVKGSSKKKEAGKKPEKPKAKLKPKRKTKSSVATGQGSAKRKVSKKTK
jgi:aspartate kinase